MAHRNPHTGEVVCGIIMKKQVVFTQPRLPIGILQWNQSIPVCSRDIHYHGPVYLFTLWFYLKLFLNSYSDGSITIGVILMNKELSFPFIEGAIQKGCIYIELSL